MSKKNFTFGYDGGIIMINPVKSEKLPQPSIEMRFIKIEFLFPLNLIWLKFINKKRINFSE